MLHQTLLSSSSSPSPSPLSSPTFYHSSSSLSMSYTHYSQVEKMEALRRSMRPEASLPADEVAWAVEKGSCLLGTDFSVEELLDLGEFAEPEKEAADADEDAKAELDGGAMASVAVNLDGKGSGDVKKEEEEEQDDKPNSNSNSNTSSGVTFDLLPLPAPPEIDLPAHDAEELEWVSRIMDGSEMDDSLPEPPLAPLTPAPYRPNYPPGAPYRSAPPPQPHANQVKIPTVCALSTEALVPTKSKRSKRARAAAWGPPVHFSDSPSSSSTTSSCSSSASFSPYFYYDVTGFVFDGNNQQLFKKPKSHKKSKKSSNSNQKPKRRGRKPKLSGAGSTMAASVTDRKCSHCGVQKTPQWRAGPEGAKTLCNACGVRYKSGRLLPEYRPACSPTFMSNVHSNSHRKVLEMRRKNETTLLSAAAPPVTSF